MCRPPVGLQPLRLLCLLCLLPGCRGDGAAAEGETGACDASSPEGCSGGAPSLRWRGFPYRLTDPKWKRTIYGGKFISAAFKEAGFEGPEEAEEWDVLWTHRPQIKTLLEMSLPPRPGQRLVNQCDYFKGAGDKCGFTRVTRSVNAAQDSGASAPRQLAAFRLNDPTETQEWLAAVREDPQKHWLLKPCYGGDSKGIRVQRGQEVLDTWASGSHPGKNLVAQEYMERLYLGFGGRKFHLRLFMLVTQASPLRAYLYNNAMVFRSLHPHAPGGKRSEQRDVFSGISKGSEGLPLAELWQTLDAPEALQRGGANSSVVWGRIAGVLGDLLGSPVGWPSGDEVQSRERQRGFGCFDLFGADVLLDEELRPWVMEINMGANLWVDNRGAENQKRLFSVKGPMVEQVFRWAALRAGSPPSTVAGGEAQEGAALLNFTRLH